MDGHQITVYLGGPMTGKTLREAMEWREHTTATLVTHGLRVLSPLRGKTSSLPMDEPLSASQSRRASLKDEALLGRDRNDLAEADIGLFNLLGAEVASIGTVGEIILAHEFRKFSIVIMEKGSIHDHPFIRAAASVVVRSLEDGIECVLEWVGVSE
jgi:nucleoside 2-deoxyribosyltransferase